MDSKLEARIDELHKELDILGQVERAARARLEGEDEEWNKTVDHIMHKMCDLVVAFKIEDPPHKAVNILGRLLGDAEKIRSPKRICVEIDNKRKLLHTLREQQRRHEAAVEASRAAVGKNKWYAGG